LFDPAGLQDNGGPTQTVAPVHESGNPAGCTGTSPALNGGDPAVCAAAPVNNLDQRGSSRPGASHTVCSTGAFEADVTPVPCMGDCNSDGEVSIDELVLGMSIMLGRATVDQCPAYDADCGPTLRIDCLVRAANSAVIGCSVSPCGPGGAGGCR
jgi:hypothetical protein